MSGTGRWRAALVPLRDRRTRWIHRSDWEWAGEVAPRLVAGLAAADADWRTETVVFTGTFLAVVTVGSPGSARRFVVKVPWTAGGVESLRRQADVLEALHLDPRLRSLRLVIPRCIGQGEVDGRYYCVEEALPGVPASAIVQRRAGRAALLAAAARVIGDLHVSTREVTLLDDATVETWVHAPLLRLATFSASRSSGNRLVDAIGRLRDELVGVLAGRTVRTSWIHGDFWPGNLLAVRPGTDVTGVVDWDRASARQLPLHDLLHLHVFSRRLERGDELGDVVIRALHGGIGEAIAVPAGQVAAWLDGIPQRPAVLLYWLRHVLLFIDTEGHYDNPRWLRANVERVLANI